METNIDLNSVPVINSDILLNHWQGHRRLTRRTIEKFPEDKLFNHSIGGMRTFSELALEMIKMAGPGMHGILHREWLNYGDLKQFADNAEPTTKEDLLKLWDDITQYIDDNWAKIPAERFMENDVAFGQWEGPIHWFIMYFIDNEIHHRGQGYVYLRSLNIEPPFFWER